MRDIEFFLKSLKSVWRILVIGVQSFATSNLSRMWTAFMALDFFVDASDLNLITV